MKILVINPGATSTKIAIYEDTTELFKSSVDHSASDLAPFSAVIEQLDYRHQLIASVIKEAGFSMTDFSAVCGRGGLLRHVPSGTYTVNDQMIEDIKHPPYGEHASNLGAVLAKSFADEVGIPAYIVDPVCVDELADIARISGFEGMERQSFFHALNHKGMARRAAKQLGARYEDLNLIVVHMGGGVSVAAHQKGRVVDVNNVKDEGCFSMDRGGTLPVNAVINLCFSGKTKDEVKKMLGSQAGVFSYLGTKDFLEVVTNAFEHHDEKSRLIYDALVYQHAKDIGTMATVLKFDVDAIILTGGMANSKRLCDSINEYTNKIAPMIILPGEAEMDSLAAGAYRVLCGESASIYQ